MCAVARGSLVALILLAAPLLAAPWIVFSEVHYHPPEGNQLEFVELFNLEAPRVDLSGWIIDGEVRFRFPHGTVLPARAHLVVAAAPEALALAHPSLAGSAARVVGPFDGRLDNGGGRIILRTPTGAVAAEMLYGRSGEWSAVPDGTGHSLVLVDPFLDPARPESWRPSTEPGGTPGRGFEDPEDADAGEALVRPEDTWRFFRGLREPPGGWQAAGFDDSAWESGPGGFGYGDGDDRTVLADMRGRYLSVYTRRRFVVSDPDALGQLVLRVDYDDGFLAFLNGEEVARSNLGPAGSEVAHRSTATASHNAGTISEHVLGPAARFLRRGENVLAVQAHNVGLGSSDLSLIAGLWSREVAPDAEDEDGSGGGTRAAALLNEVSLAGDWVELFNPSDREIDLAGFSLSDDPKRLRKVELGGARKIAPGEYLVLRGPTELAGLALGKPDLRLFLTAPTGRVVDALSFEAGAKTEDPRGRDAEDAERRAPEGIASRGRYPDGAAPPVLFETATPGRPNVVRPAEALVLSEIMYHPMAGRAGGEYVEILNTGSEAIDLDGYKLSGGARYDFKPGERIEPGEHLVVARDPEALAAAHGLPREEFAGPFRGALSDGGERLTLVGPSRGGFPGRVIDSVAYATADPWPAWADGFASSLELVHPECDNALAQAWAASDEASRSEWRTFEYSRELAPGLLCEASSLQFMLLEVGACLIDDVRLAHSSGRVIVEDSFENGARWLALGTHGASRLVEGDPRERDPRDDDPSDDDPSDDDPSDDDPSDDDPSGRAPRLGHSFELVADGRGNPRHNYVSLTLPELLDPRESYTVSFRARWLRGSPLLLSRTAGQGLARLHRLAVPAPSGTPGRPNNRYAPSPPPLVGVPRQSPVAPSSRQPVTITVPICARDEIAEAAVLYRAGGDGDWRRVPLVRETAGGHRHAAIWKGTIPALNDGTVEFHIVARDTKGLAGTFPRGAPERTALYAVGIAARNRFPTYTVLVSEREWRAFEGRERLSNRAMDATLVYGDSRIFYNVDFRLRGSPFTRRGRNWRLVFGAETLDGRRSLTFDGQGTDARERLTYWLAGELHVPAPRLRYVQVDIPGQPQESGVYEEVEKVGGDFLSRWFEDATLPASAEAGLDAGVDPAPGNPFSPFSTGLLHKVDDHWELLPPGEHRVRGRGFFSRLFGAGRRSPDRSYAEAFFRFTSADPEDYRWNFPPRANGTGEDFEPLIRLVRLLDPHQTPDDVFTSEVEKEVDVDQWLRVLAARTAVNDWDSIGLERGKNAYLYRSPADGRWRMIPWDADLSWSSRSPYTPIRSLFSRKFLAVRRLLAHPPYRRQFLSYLAYLMERKLEATHISGILADLRRRTGRSPSGISDFAAASREWFAGQVAPELRGPFEVRQVERVSSTGKGEAARLSGTAPLIVHRLELAGREGVIRFLDDRHWVGEFPAAGGALELRAFDFGGEEVARTVVEVPAR